jgi:hypothetical protein
MSWTIESSRLGRIAVPADLPDSTVVFCTSSDFGGRLSPGAIDALSLLMRERFGFEGALASCGQVHGVEVAVVNGAAHPWCEAPGCDAIVSDGRPVALAIKIADCLPVSLLDTAGGATANIHSGWRGAAAGIVPATLRKMSGLHGTLPSSIRAWLGPSIRVCCFEVGEDVVDALETAYGDVTPFVDRPHGSKPHVDLTGLTAHLLEKAGVPARSIDDSGMCTRCPGSIFHSFRRNREASGRNLMLIGLRS